MHDNARVRFSSEQRHTIEHHADRVGFPVHLSLPRHCIQSRCGLDRSARRSESAADFLTELDADPAYVKKRGAQEGARVVREAEISLITRPLLQELAAAGYPATSLDELLKRYAPLPPAIVTLLLDSLTEVADTAVQEQMVRALGASADAFDGTPLITVFQNTHSAGLQYAIVNTMAQADVRDVTRWILDAVQDPVNGTARQMLALAAARRNPSILAIILCFWRC